eukprot:848645-Pleurochrysis_carterae.AAC.2
MASHGGVSGVELGIFKTGEKTGGGVGRWLGGGAGVGDVTGGDCAGLVLVSSPGGVGLGDSSWPGCFDDGGGGSLVCNINGGTGGGVGRWLGGGAG